MTKSEWRCPACHRPLMLRNSGYYWCVTCSREWNGERIDPMHRDAARNQIIGDMQLERMGIL